MKVVDFAAELLKAWSENPELQNLNDLSSMVRTVATVLGHPGLPSHNHPEVYSSYAPLALIEAGPINRVAVNVSDRTNSQIYEHFFFEWKGGAWKHIPTGEGCSFSMDDYAIQANGWGGLSARKTEIGWPWLALFPEKFKDVSDLNELLVPGDSNPLTGLLQSNDRLVRTLASQIRDRLTAIRDQALKRASDSF